jgi:DNA gyrase subunit A
MDLMAHVPGPDFPTAAMINGAQGIRDAYLTGRGKIYLRARASFEESGDSGKYAIVVTELPYQVNKARLLEKIAFLVKEGKLEGITALRDESDKDGMRMVIELRRGEVPAVILNNLYQNTQLQAVFGINMVALINGRPKCMNLKEVLAAFIDHRREVVTRRTIYNLRKARERAHLLEGLAVAMANIDEMIALIKAAKNPAEAKVGLLAQTWASGIVSTLLESADAARSRPDGLPEEFGIHGQQYRLSAEQAQAILNLQLHRLTGLEQEKIVTEYQSLLEQIDDYLDILSSSQRLMTVIREELESIKEQFSDERRTEILQEHLNLSAEDLITEEDVVVTVSHEGYVKSQSLETYKSQRRGGRGKSATKTKDADFIDQIIVTNTHDIILCFSSAGKVYWLKTYQLPSASRNSRGKPFVNLFNLDKNERINAILPVREYTENQYIFMATAQGTVKKTPLIEFKRQRASGKIAIDLKENDRLVGVAITDGEQDVLLFSSAGKSVCFNETDVRSMGRTAAGVRGIRLAQDQQVISLIIATGGTVLSITENGFGKRTRLSDFPCHKRGGQGVIAIQTTERNGDVVGAVLVSDDDEIMLITDAGTLVRTRINEITVVGRNTQGVTIIKLGKNERVVGVDRIAGLPDDISEERHDKGEEF